MTLKQYMDSTKLALGRLGVAEDINDPMLITYINHGRRTAQRFSLDLMPECYGKIARFSVDSLTAVPNPFLTFQNRYLDGQACTYYMINMPERFLDAHVVKLTWTDAQATTYSSEARRASLKELYNVGMQVWNTPTTWRPIYTVATTISEDAPLIPLATPDNPIVYLSGFGEGAESILNNGSTGIEVEIWYVEAINDMEYTELYNLQAEEDTAVPVMLEELVVNYAVLSCLRHMNATTAIDSVKNEKRLLESIVTKTYAIGKEQEVKSLETKKEWNTQFK